MLARVFEHFELYGRQQRLLSNNFASMGVEETSVHESYSILVPNNVYRSNFYSVQSRQCTR